MAQRVHANEIDAGTKIKWKSNNATHITPSSDLVQQIVASEAQVHDALVHRAAGPLRREVRLRDLHPAERAHEEADRAPVVGLWAGGVAAASVGGIR